MKQHIWTTSFVANSFLVDSDRKLSLYGLLSLMQESAWSHASHLGHGFSETRASGESWVVARQRVEMETWPDWGQDVVVRTWLRPPGAVLVTRDFEFLVKNQPMGRASAHWLTIDHKTRRPTRIPFPDDPSYFRHEGHLDSEPVKLPTHKDLANLARFRVGHSDLDMNGHVNNTRFAQWILDSLPLDIHSKFHLMSYQVNFLAEARPGDDVHVEGLPSQRLALNRAAPFQGRRADDGTILFTAQLLARNL
jgi:acyl-ACP thioesterase